jgi:hypothetical protein
MKFLAILPATLIAATPVMAGPYVNIESESKSTGVDFNKTVLRNDVGYEGAFSESTKYYIQGGPAFVMPDGKATTTEASGKVGIKTQLSERLGAYSEFKFLTSGGMDLGEPIGTTAKAGVKYKF